MPPRWPPLCGSKLTPTSAKRRCCALASGVTPYFGQSLLKRPRGSETAETSPPAKRVANKSSKAHGEVSRASIHATVSCWYSAKTTPGAKPVMAPGATGPSGAAVPSISSAERRPEHVRSSVKGILFAFGGRHSPSAFCFGAATADARCSMRATAAEAAWNWTWPPSCHSPRTTWPFAETTTRRTTVFSPSASPSSAPSATPVTLVHVAETLKTDAARSASRSAASSDLDKPALARRKADAATRACIDARETLPSRETPGAPATTSVATPTPASPRFSGQTRLS
mmetsp:Transcript_13263/g.44327  ORF Transcript_13263/g.44327 Transcript_13263/m.44327 type:complete len:284 (-) Transcript_13263:498-1349(-)